MPRQDALKTLTAQLSPFNKPWTPDTEPRPKLPTERDTPETVPQKFLRNLVDMVMTATGVKDPLFDEPLDKRPSLGAGIGMVAGVLPWGAGKLFSRVDKVAETLPKVAHPNKIASLMKSGAAKEEIGYRGLADWLKSKGDVMVPKGEVVEHLAKNPAPKVERTVLGEAVPQTGEYGGTRTEPTKFHSYQLPGGENYRETLLTLDKPQPTVVDLGEGSGGRWAVKMPDGTISSHYYDRGDAERALAFDGRTAGTTFTSSHFDQPNVLVHTRHNDRPDAAGNPIRFLEEVQSDWHQQGKAKGYLSNRAPIALTSAEQQELDTLMQDARQIHGFYNTPDGIRAAELLERQTPNAVYGGVPDAPFKDSWPDLALKQQLLDVAQNPDLKGIGFTTGKTQAERYDLSKQLDGLNIERIGGPGEPIYVMHGQTTSGRTVNFGAVETNKLPDVIGKEMARRIVDNPEQVQRYSGLDLQVGGEGMTYFYDNLLPKRLEKLVKPFGGTVERGFVQGKDTPLTNSQYFQNAPTPHRVLDARGRPVQERIMRDGEPFATVLPGPDSTDTYDYLQRAQKLATDIETQQPNVTRASVPAWIARLTPEQKQRMLKEGFPLLMAIFGTQLATSHKQEKR